MSDLISRKYLQDTIMPMAGMFTDEGFYISYDRVLSIIENAPSAKIEGDLISRQEALKEIQMLYPGRPFIPLNINKWQEKYEQYLECENVILKLPSVEKEGEWVEVPYKKQGHEEVVIDGTSWRCTNCGDARKRNEPDMEYCPHCGARMGRRNDDD